jgi:PilZ domain
MDQSAITQNRRSSRSPVLLSAKLSLGGDEVSVVLRNLSSEGALVEGAQLPVEGSATVFKRNDLNAPGRVVWVAGRYAGIAFDRKLEPAELLRQVPRPRKKLEPQFRRPGFASQPLTDSDRKMLEMWATSGPMARPGD